MPINTAILSKYPNKTFIETGTYQGDGVRAAMGAGFKTIYSIEVDPKYHNKARAKLQPGKDVHLLLGDSSKLLLDILNGLTEPATFWLDAHEAVNVPCPILKEIALICAHNALLHTILIDDLRIFRQAQKRYDHISLSDVIGALHGLGGTYLVEEIDSTHWPKDILVARPVA